ncbi:MAG TPA: hypothetical protein VGQ83_13810 [Polyangia bacterium]|jgi:hypothetical protein
MRLGAKVWRLAKLGFFVGWGAAATVLAACGASAPRGPIDSGVDARPAADAAPRDGGAGDAGDAASAPADAGPQDATGWDVPLE